MTLSELEDALANLGIGRDLSVFVEGCDCEGAAVGVALITEGHGAPYVLIHRGEADGMYLRELKRGDQGADPVVHPKEVKACESSESSQGPS